MSDENVEFARRAYLAYNHAAEEPDPLPAIRAVWEEFADPQIEWQTADAPTQQGTWRGIEGIMEFFETLIEAFDETHQFPERFIDAGDRVVVFVHTVARAHASGMEIDEHWAHVTTFRDGKIVRIQMFREHADALEAAGAVGVAALDEKRRFAWKAAVGLR
jgi:ketosteroid isomerase-like protein